MKCSMSVTEPKAIFSLVTFEKESLRSWPAPLLSLSSSIKTSRHKKRQSATLVPSSACFSVAAGCSLSTSIIWHQLQASLLQRAARGHKSDKGHWQTPNTMGPLNTEDVKRHHRSIQYWYRLKSSSNESKQPSWKEETKSWNAFQGNYMCTNWRNKVMVFYSSPAKGTEEQDQSSPLPGFSGLAVAVYH